MGIDGGEVVPGYKLQGTGYKFPVASFQPPVYPGSRLKTDRCEAPVRFGDKQTERTLFVS